MLVREEDLPVLVKAMELEALVLLKEGLVLVQEKDLPVLVLVSVMVLVALEMVQERDLQGLVLVMVLEASELVQERDLPELMMLQ